MIPSSTFAEVVLSKTFPKATTVSAVFVTSELKSIDSQVAHLPPAAHDAAKLLAGTVATGKIADVSQTAVKVGTATHIILAIGLGPVLKVTTEELRKAGAAAYRTARKLKAANLAFTLPTLAGLKPAEVAEALATGALLRSFEFTDYVGTRRAKEFAEHKKIVTLHLLSTDASVKAGLDRATKIALSVNFARTIASRPGNDINPVTLAGVAKSLAKDAGLKFSVLDEKQLKKLGCGGIIGVGQGSPTPPRLITLEHKPAKPINPGKPILIVGKSITFDTGGISIKPAEKMGKMIYDKCGGMAVLGLMAALASLKTNVHVIGLLSAAENHVSGEAYRPGDILTLHNGVTVEITNTDAEGRLVLADAISWGIDTYKPATVIDLATLTGGCVVALGTTMAGLFSNNDDLATALTHAGAGQGEKMWRLPVGDDQRDMLKSELADVVNSAGRWASPLTGAAFVSLAVPPDGSIPWAHLDIAGVADVEKEHPYLGKGSTGYGIRLLLTWIEGMK